MAKSPKLYGIYDRETNLIFCGNLDECSKFLNVDKISFHRMIKWCKDSTDIVYEQFVQNQGTIYFKTRELAQKAIEEVGQDRLKKYVFNVKE